ncbi:MAG: 3-oxoacyl-ACP reductase family protein [Smithellaceae bacterium]|jgi:3-oxoacyl-[acyl-carrier protein] reductase
MMEKPVALVTGGAIGIGAACCRALSAEGFRVGVHYRKSGEQAQKVLEEIKDGFLIQADLANIEDVDAMIGRLKENTKSIDVLVNNAGQSINADIFSMKIEQFDEQRALTRGVWYMTKRILRQFMLRSRAGRIINISSVVGHVGNAGQIPYTMEKAALDAFTRSLAQELRGRNILVNSVAPGFIETEMTQELPEEVKSKIMASIILNRIGLPEEVAEVVAFLAKKGSYITGSVIHVNGGLYGG